MSIDKRTGKEFVDESTECAICLEAFDADGEGAGDGKEEHTQILTLTCGHKWHLACLVDQLQTAQPVPGKRLLFNGCQCAKCGTICEHAELEHLTRTTDALRQQVDALVEEQLTLEAPQVLEAARRETNDDSLSLKKVIQEARRKYAFYLCSHCRKPYFGGTVECADALEPPTDGGRDMTSAERLCVACAPQSQVVCQNPLAHRGHIIWKCRFCCQPATHVCYGNTHFCSDCHDRNTARYTLPPSSRPPSIASIPCPGDACTYPKPAGTITHQNGSTMACEQVYGCACCQSASNRQGHVERPGSRNFVQNPSGSQGLTGWTQRNPRMSWQVEDSDLPVQEDASTTTRATNFVSSFQPCIMQQVMDLNQILKSPLRESPRNYTFEVSARYMGRTDCPSVFRLQAIALDMNRRVIQQQATDVLEAPPDYWERAEVLLNVEAAQRPRYIAVIVVGQDRRFWQGLFGSKVCQIQLRLLGSPHELQACLREGVGETVRNQDRRLNDEVGPENHHQGRRPQESLLVLLRDGLLPIVVLLLLAWLLQ